MVKKKRDWFENVTVIKDRTYKAEYVPTYDRVDVNKKGHDSIIGGIDYGYGKPEFTLESGSLKTMRRTSKVLERADKKIRKTRLREKIAAQKEAERKREAELEKLDKKPYKKKMKRL